MNFLLKHIRQAVYILNAVIGIGAYYYVTKTVSSPTLQNIRLAEIYGFVAVILLYLALLASPLYKAFPAAPLKSIYMPARPAFGVSAFFFAAAHSFIGFFKLFGGFPGLGFLSSRYLLGIAFSAAALLILAVMAATSNSYSRERLGKIWKRIHNFVHLAGALIIIHVFMLGTHFRDLSRPIPQIFFYAVLFLLVLEALRMDKAYQEKFGTSARFGPVFVLSVVILTLLASMILIPHGGLSLWGVHSHP
jgi:DMSO/TMAO reductase YedYZ heme-binding membrane subunit